MQQQVCLSESVWLSFVILRHCHAMCMACVAVWTAAVLESCTCAHVSWCAADMQAAVKVAAAFQASLPGWLMKECKRQCMSLAAVLSL
jgi:hypothetical protein